MTDKLIQKIIDFEQGQLDDDATIALFQEMVDSGIVWQLQGSYGRTAAALIEAGWVQQKQAPMFEAIATFEA